MAQTESFVDLMEQYLAGHSEAARQLASLLYPIVQSRVARVLRASNRVNCQEMEDITQEVFTFLFRENCRTLRSWKPNGGLSFRNFVGMVAARQAISLLRTERQWRQVTNYQDFPNKEIDSELVENSEPAVISRDLLETLLGRLQEHLTPLGMEIFRLTFLEECTVKELCTQLHLSSDGVYAWRSRLRKKVENVFYEMNS